MMVSLESLTVIPHLPEVWLDASEPQNTIYIIYNGQQYDALVAMSDGRKLFQEFELEEMNSYAIVLATDEKVARDKELCTRIRKKLKCSCGEICENSLKFQEHAQVVDHGEDWGYECEEITVEELVSSATDE